MFRLGGRASPNVGRASLNVAVKGVIGTVLHIVELVSSFQSKCYLSRSRGLLVTVNSYTLPFP